jgi:hypothetical protein
MVGRWQVEFIDRRPAELSEQEVAEVERMLGVRFPSGLSTFFMLANGGHPVPPIYDHNGIVVRVHGTLALRAHGDSALRAYGDLVTRWKSRPNLFPFANDEGGNLFCVDCDTSTGAVVVVVLDRPDAPISLDVDIDEFWTHMRVEEPESESANAG